MALEMMVEVLPKEATVKGEALTEGEEQVGLLPVTPQIRAAIFGTRPATERLSDRAGELAEAVKDGLGTIGKSLADYREAPEGWTLTEVSATFGLTLTAETGVIFAKAGGSATLEVTVTFSNK